MNPALAPHEVQLFAQPGTAKVEKTITRTQPGRVKFNTTYWPARLYHLDNQTMILPNELVTVVGRQGITLLVVSASH